MNFASRSVIKLLCREWNSIVFEKEDIHDIVHGVANVLYD